MRHGLNPGWFYLFVRFLYHLHIDIQNLSLLYTTQTHTLSRIHPHRDKHIISQTHTHTHWHTPTHTHTDAHIHTHTHTNTRTHYLSHSPPHTNTHTHANIISTTRTPKPTQTQIRIHGQYHEGSASLACRRRLIKQVNMRRCEPSLRWLPQTREQVLSHREE